MAVYKQAKFKKTERTEKEKQSGFVKVGSTYVTPESFDVLMACIATSQPALLVGETGTGKTSFVRELAEAHKQDLIRVSLNGTTGVEEILGKWLAKDGDTIWNDGILVTAMKEGKWIIFDEINAALPEVLFTLHSLLDDDRKVMLVEKDNEVLKPHDDFRFFASMNPPEDYAGTKDVNRALLSRFQAIIKVEPMPNEVEFQVLVDQTGVDDASATVLVQLGQMLRDAKSKGDIFYFCSTRDLLHASRLKSAGCSINESITYAIANKMSSDEYTIVKPGLDAFISINPAHVRTISSMVEEFSTLEKNLKEAQGALDKAQRDMTTYKDAAETNRKIATEAREALRIAEAKIQRYTAELAIRILNAVDEKTVNEEKVLLEAAQEDGTLA